jgi:hypothetical protein
MTYTPHSAVFSNFPPRETSASSTRNGTILEYITEEYQAGPMALLANTDVTPVKRIDAFFAAMYRFYASKPIGCPVGHAVSNADSVSDAMRRRAAAVLTETEKLFIKLFAARGHEPGMANVLVSVTINAWQGAVLTARQEGGLKHLQNAFQSIRILAKREVAAAPVKSRR